MCPLIQNVMFFLLHEDDEDDEDDEDSSVHSEWDLTTLTAQRAKIKENVLIMVLKKHQLNYKVFFHY